MVSMNKYAGAGCRTLQHSISTVLIAAFFFLYAPACLAATALPERPFNHVVDLADIVEPEIEAGLNRYLLELEQKTTAQVIVLTITSLEDQPIEDLALDIAHNKWKLGQKGKDNGLLLLVALQDRKYRFEVGYGLEGVLPDSLVGSIGRDYLVPYFKEGNYSKGITAGTLAVINTIAAEAGVEIAGMPKMRITPGRSGRAPNKILSILFFIGLIYMFIKHPRLLMLLLVSNMLGGGRRDGWGGGGGSFGGGGGGGFGGGGSSGGW